MSSKSFAQECQRRASRKECQEKVSSKSVVQQECPARVSRKSLEQESPAKVSSKSVKKSQERVSRQECLARVPCQECPARVSSKECLAKSVEQRVKRQCPVNSVQQECQECPARVSNKSVKQECPAKVPSKSAKRVLSVVGGVLDCGVAECKCADNSDQERKQTMYVKIDLLHSGSWVLPGLTKKIAAVYAMRPPCVNFVSALAAPPNVVRRPAPAWARLQTPRLLPSVSAMCPLVLSLSARCLLFIRSLSAFVGVYGLALAEPLSVLCLFCPPPSRSLYRVWLCLCPLFVWPPLTGSALVCQGGSPHICTLSFVFPLCPGFLY